MNKCLNCEKEVKNKYCNVSCQNSHQNTDRSNRKFGKFLDFVVKCASCNKEISVNERENLHPQKEKYYCGRKCANIRLDDKSESKTILCSKCLLQKNVNKRSKQKICNSCQIKPKRKLRNLVEFICEVCNKNFQDKKSRVYCSKSCSTIKRNKDGMARKAGLKSVHSQSRRSKNEIAFANLCINKFTKVLTNEPLFNGWDADIIIEDLKVAILWNGVWHYKKITEKHSLLQIQNRDSIKIDEIVKYGYIPYVIKDMGKFSMEKVEGEWLKFNEWIESFKF